MLTTSLVGNTLVLWTVIAHKRSAFLNLDSQPNFICYCCVTQLKPYILYTSWVPLYSVVFEMSGISNTRPNFHVFQYIQTNKPFADPVLLNTKQCQLLLIKYQPVSTYTDPVPSSATYTSSSGKAQLSQLNNFSFYDSSDESRTVYLVEFQLLVTTQILIFKLSDILSNFEMSNWSRCSRPVTYN